MRNPDAPIEESSSKLRVLMLHSAYRHLGGEDVSARVEAELLESAGHEVELVELDHLRDGNLSSAALEILLGRRGRSYVAKFRPDILHVQNFFPLVPPQVLRDAHANGAATVLTLRNYRTSCLAGTHHRQGGPCTACNGSKLGMPAIRNSCYQGSALISAAGQLALNRYSRRKIWTESIDRYIAVSPHVVDKVRHIIPEERVVVKPNSISLVPEVGTGRGQYAVAVGRLSPEKGIRRLAKQWASHEELPMLRILGAGPDESAIRSIANKAANVAYLGPVARDDVFNELADARITVVPSTWNEPFGRIVIESYAVGTPVLWNTTPGTKPPGGFGDHLLGFGLDDPPELARTIEALFSSPAHPRRAAARKVFDADFAPDVNLCQLESIYREALQLRKKRIAISPA